MSKFSTEVFNEYIETLKGKVYKVLPLIEEDNVGVFKYINSLINELNGLQYIINHPSILITIIATLESVLDEQLAAEYDLQFIKSELFKCISLINKLQLKGE